MLIVSDTHIPERAVRVPSRVEAFIREKASFDIVVHGGDLVEAEVLEWLRYLGNRVYAVKGNMDYLNLPERVTIDLDGVKIGVVHGHQVYPRGNIKQLTEIAREMKVHVLVSGHTHSPFIVRSANIIHVNPGSLTGVWGGGGGSMKPSFAVMVVNPSELRVEVYLYEDDGTRVKLVQKASYTVEVE